MNRTKATIVFLILTAIVSSGIFFSSCKKKSLDGMIIFTRVNGIEQDRNYFTGENWRYTQQSQILALDPDNPDRSPELLTGEYYSARSPEISFDGKHLLFTARQKQNDPWQIWEMNLDDSSIQKVTSTNDDCIDPAYLPGDRVVFSRLAINDTLKAGHSLYTCKTNGSDIKRVSFNPHTYFASSILKDGRILSISRQLYPEKGNPEFIVLRPDGTKAELFYKGSEGSVLLSRGLETTDNKIVFIESDNKDNKGENIISISYNRPMHSRANLTSEITGSFKDVFPLQSGKILVSYRPSGSGRFILSEFDPVSKTLGKIVFSNTDFDAIEPVVVRSQTRPKKLPSEVDMGVKTGLLLCQDINVIDPKSNSASFVHSKAFKIRVVGIDSTLGAVQVEKDGSFYLKVMADKPFQIQTLDKDGKLLNSHCDWIWLRPNERRGCVGCHEDPERVPENKVPIAVRSLPIVIPVHINKLNEKKVSLE